MEYNERFLPNGWVRTVEEVVNNNFERNYWPTIEQIDCNLFNLSVDINTKIDDEAFKSYEDSVLNFRLDNNDITLIQRKRYVEREPIELKVPSVEEKGKEFIYELKVVDRSTQAIMYYKVNLERVEINKPIGDDLKPREINEDLDVIGPLDEDDDNPFETEFEAPEDCIEKTK